MRRVVSAAAAAVVVLLGVSGCVGPARSTQTYESKAVRSADDGLSALQTALLVVQAGLRGRTTAAYRDVLLSRSEDSFSSIQQTFDSIQPPDSSRADDLRNSLDKLLSDGVDGLAQLRILARRHDSNGLAAQAHDLVATADELNKFAQSHG